MPPATHQAVFDVRFVRRAGLTPEERALLAEPWYHNFFPFGVPTPDPGSSHQRNQRAKQPRLFALIEKAIRLCTRERRPADGLELFCSDGFYSMHALRAGARGMVGVDLDEGALARARLMARILGYDGRCRFEARDVFAVEGIYDFAICAGGLYHLEDPRRLLVALRSQVRVALVIQTVFSLARAEPTYFETPAPGWSWGCRFSYEYLQRMVRSAGWEILESATSPLEGNTRPEDRGSAYLLCVPTRPVVDDPDWHRHVAGVAHCPEHAGALPAPGLRLAEGAAVIEGARSYTLARHSLHPHGSQSHTHPERALLAPFMFPVHLQHRSVLDLGGDAGLAGLWAAQEGAERVTCLDADARYVDLVARAAGHLGITNVSARQGSLDEWAEPADVVLALAPANAAISSGGPVEDLDAVVGKLAVLTGYLLLLEWMGPERPASTASAGGSFVDEDLFAALRRHFKRVEKVGDICPTHRLYAAYRTSREIQPGWPLPFVLPLSTVVSGRLLVTVDGVDYCSRVYLDRERQRVLKQTTMDLAEREYLLLRRLESDYFPRALALRRAEAQSIVEMELVKGTPLEDCRDEVAATLDSTVRFMRHCLAMLAELRRHGIQHRDIRPDNILVRSGRPVLIDFGWAIAEDMPYCTPADLDPSRIQAGREIDDVFDMGRLFAWLKGPRYPRLDLVIGLMAQDDPALRVADLPLLDRLLRAVAREAGPDECEEEA